MCEEVEVEEIKDVIAILSYAGMILIRFSGVSQPDSDKTVGTRRLI
jgi:hypothetical protein